MKKVIISINLAMKFREHLYLEQITNTVAILSVLDIAHLKLIKLKYLINLENSHLEDESISKLDHHSLTIGDLLEDSSIIPRIEIIATDKEKLEVARYYRSWGKPEYIEIIDDKIVYFNGFGVPIGHCDVNLPLHTFAALWVSSEEETRYRIFHLLEYSKYIAKVTKLTSNKYLFKGGIVLKSKGSKVKLTREFTDKEFPIIEKISTVLEDSTFAPSTFWGSATEDLDNFFNREALGKITRVMI